VGAATGEMDREWIGGVFLVQESGETQSAVEIRHTWVCVVVEGETFLQGGEVGQAHVVDNPVDVPAVPGADHCVREGNWGDERYVAVYVNEQSVDPGDVTRANAEAVRLVDH
jgi:hypothetical protein